MDDRPLFMKWEEIGRGLANSLISNLALLACLLIVF